MALLSLGEAKWRMLRRVVRKKRFTFEDARNGARSDRVYFDRLVGNGFVVAVADGDYELTARGRQAADMGLYELEPAGQGSGAAT